MHIRVSLGDRIERVEVSDEEILYFPKGIIGFEEVTRFALFHLEPPLYLLQSAEDPHTGFVVLDPFLVDPSYRIPAREGCALLELDEEDRRSALSIVTLSAAGVPQSVNLRAPIVLNATKRLGTQVILQEDRSVRHRLGATADGRLLLDSHSSPAEEPRASDATASARRH